MPELPPSPDHTGFLLGHVLVTLCWVVAAVFLLMRGDAVRWGAPGRIARSITLHARSDCSRPKTARPAAVPARRARRATG
ncbi:MAG: hypothetical protein GEU98_26745 [Pseudonocardiaceae bacterium]|nr:hypothetical protein [Pseudonocardiaceae bacterium]